MNRNINLPKRKLLLLNTSYQVGGAEKSMLDVLKAISSDYSPLLTVPQEGAFYETLRGHYPVVIIPLIRLKRKGNLKALIKMTVDFIRQLRRLTALIREHQIDIIYANTISAQCYAILLKLITGKKVVSHVRDNLRSRILAHLLCWCSDKLICVSNFIKASLPTSGKVEVVYNGIDADLWVATGDFRDQVRQELKLAHGTLIVAHVGQLIPWKRHDLFIDVAAHLLRCGTQNVHFVIIGDDLFNDFPDYKKYLTSKVQAAGLSANFSFLHYRTNIEVYLSSIDILVHLADQEPFGRVLLEAMACQKPVISKNRGGPQEIIVDHTSGFLVNTSEVANIADRVMQLLQNATLREQFGKAGRSIVEQKFTLNNLSKINNIIGSMYEACSY